MFSSARRRRGLRSFGGRRMGRGCLPLCQGLTHACGWGACRWMLPWRRFMRGLSFRRWKIPGAAAWWKVPDKSFQMKTCSQLQIAQIDKMRRAAADGHCAVVCPNCAVVTAHASTGPAAESRVAAPSHMGERPMGQMHPKPIKHKHLRCLCAMLTEPVAGGLAQCTPDSKIGVLLMQLGGFIAGFGPKGGILWG